jgi:hypothetical protein
MWHRHDLPMEHRLPSGPALMGFLALLQTQVRSPCSASLSPKPPPTTGFPVSRDAWVGTYPEPFLAVECPGAIYQTSWNLFSLPQNGTTDVLLLVWLWGSETRLARARPLEGHVRCCLVVSEAILICGPLCQPPFSLPSLHILFHPPPPRHTLPWWEPGMYKLSQDMVQSRNQASWYLNLNELHFLCSLFPWTESGRKCWLRCRVS